MMSRPGGPDVLVPATVPDPNPGPGDVVVRVAATGVNFIDTYRRSGIYPFGFPGIPGTEGAGTVVSLGADVADVSEGDRVAWIDGPGSYAELVVVPATRLIAVPDEVPLETAAAVGLQGLTAHYLATSTYPIDAGDPVLVHAGAGGVGLLLTQIAVLLGGQVITTVSTERKAGLSRQAGARHVLNYGDMHDLGSEIPAAVRALTSGLGVRAVYDGVGRATFDASLGALGRRGTLVLFGGSSGQVPPFDLQRLSAGGSLYVTRPTLGDYVDTTEALRSRAADLFGWIASGELDVRIGATFALANAADAHIALESRETTGKVLLVP